MPTSRHESMLRAAGLRVTRPRRTILEVLDAGDHLDADAVAHATRALLGHLSTQAVYDALNTFTRLGLIRRIEPAGHPARYETRVGDNHHHLVCRRCGTTVDVDCVAGAAPCLTPSPGDPGSTGFVLDEAEVTFWGLCSTCCHGTGATIGPAHSPRRLGTATDFDTETETKEQA